MNGDISVESTVGNGSIFRFTVLLKISKRLKNKMILEKLNGVNVLVVDDNASTGIEKEEAIKILNDYIKYLPEILEKIRESIF